MTVYTQLVYTGIVIDVVELPSLVKKQLKKLPIHIVVRFQNWVEDVEERGLEEVRKISGSSR